jgi:uncharacterized membrane protein YccC
MSADTLTVGELVDELRRLKVHNNDFTNVTALELRAQPQRVRLVAIPREEDLTGELRNLIQQTEQQRAELAVLKGKKDKLRKSLRSIRENLRSRKPRLP